MRPLERLGETARKFLVPLSSDSLRIAEEYIALLLEYNARTNLTADTDLDSLYLRHLADGFPAAAFLRETFGKGSAPRIADLGAGAGFIGFAIKLAWPQAEVTLIEALQRKFDFLNIAALKSGFKGLRVVKARVAGAPPPVLFDAVVERALAPLDQALGPAVSLLKPGGTFIAYQSDPVDGASPVLEKVLARLRARFVDLVTYRLPHEARDRHLAVFKRED